MNRLLGRVVHLIATYLQKPASGYEPFTPRDPIELRKSIKPGDVLLVEGHNHISGMIKYLTQSTWSHAALYVGEIIGTQTANNEPCELIESIMEAGVIAVPLSKYFKLHTRICRPVSLSAEDCKKVCDYGIARVGFQYDLKNLIDLARYLLPLPVSQRWRRRMIALGSGDQTRLICSALIAQAFQSVGYPILPSIDLVRSEHARQEIFHILDSSLFTPRDFDISPYFEVINQTVDPGFDYKKIRWTADPMEYSGGGKIVGN
jgi:hypothetical protein